MSVEQYTPDMSALYRWADVLVAPSTNPEPFGMTVIEAMSYGVVAVASRLGGHLDTVTEGSTGLLFDPAQPAELARALSQLAADPEQLAHFSEASISRSRHAFSMERFASQIVTSVTGAAQHI